MKESNIKAVFFDAGGTLLYPYPSVGHVYSEVAARHGVVACKDEINAAFKEVWHARDKINEAKSFENEKSEKNWWRVIVKEVFSSLGEFDDFEAFFEELFHDFACTKTWKLFDDVHDVLGEVKKRGMKVGMISNWDSRLLHLCEAFDLKKYFDFILISALFGKAKPHSDIFNEALKLAHVRAAEAVHIGDSLEDDVRGAAAVGIRPVWLNVYARDSSEEHTQHSFDTVQQLSGLLKVL